MILSGYADEETLRNGLEIAHQYLTKPCDSETLIESIAQIFKIQECVNNPRIITNVGKIAHFPSLPKIYHELNKAIADEFMTNQKIAQILAQDMALSAKLIQLVNSPFFGMNRKVSNLTEAVNLIGGRKLNNLIFKVHISEAFPMKDPVALNLMETLWQNAIRTAELAKLISLAEQQKDDRPDQAYLGGLLHNMGLLIFMALDEGKGKLSKLLAEVKQSSVKVPDLEQQIFGFNRYEVAAYVLSLWKIPPRVIEAILLQNQPSATNYNEMNALTAVHVAAALLNQKGETEEQCLFSLAMDEEYLRRINKLDRLPEWKRLADSVMRQF